MEYSIKKIVRLLIGLFVCAFGIVLTINANLGLSPWEAFHHGISINLGITMGQASIGLGIIIIIIDIVLGENFGLGTILNMLLIGVFMDFLMLNNIIPKSNHWIIGFIMMFIGMFIIGLGCVLYIGAGYGSGPRDGLMIALQKKSNKPIKLIKMCIELFALIFGYLLGGSIGIGTVITTLVFGVFIQYAFEICKFDTKKIKHRYIVDDIKHIRYKLLRQRNKEYAIETIVDKSIDE
ncbi:MAG: hypothetical protein RR942_18100 [Romboutsia sp.]|uniref:YczE/YyaS/YitT family protein n=1 Tax=Paraclostridium sp. TaxID=2023273 RepID=UPI003AA14858